MNIEKNILEMLKKFDDLESSANTDLEKYRKDASDLSFKAIENIHKWSLTVITLASAILGYSCTELLKSTQVYNKSLIYIGMVFFGITLIYGITYFKRKFEKDFNRLSKTVEDLTEIIYVKCEKMRVRIVREGDAFDFEKGYKEFLEEREKDIERLKPKDLNKKEYFMDILYYLFLCGLTSISLAFVPFHFLISCFKN